MDSLGFLPPLPILILHSELSDTLNLLYINLLKCLRLIFTACCYHNTKCGDEYYFSHNSNFLVVIFLGQWYPGA